MLIVNNHHDVKSLPFNMVLKQQHSLPLFIFTKASLYFANSKKLCFPAEISQNSQS
ncbi:hypothetical protein HMPREF1870_02081 [Bacteroidales bacterium KA00344]|nr:hypothetical protein HMPREF1870_02081 [Bacteroidales bacterium KA00344]